MHVRTENISHRRRRQARGFTMVELMLVLIIMSIATVLSLDAIANFESSERPTRAAKEVLFFFRYARNVAMTNSNKAKVTINTAAGTIQVYTWNSATSKWTIANVSFAGAGANGTMTLNLTTEGELVGTTMTVNPSGTTDFVYSAVGSCSPTGSITFNYGAKNHTLTIPTVGDPQL